MVTKKDDITRNPSMVEIPNAVFDPLLESAEIYEVAPTGNKTLLADYGFVTAHNSTIYVRMDRLPVIALPAPVVHDFDLPILMALLDYDINALLMTINGMGDEEAAAAVQRNSIILSLRDSVQESLKPGAYKEKCADVAFSRVVLSMGMPIPLGLLVHWAAIMATIRQQLFAVEILAGGITWAIGQLRSRGQSEDVMTVWGQVREEISRQLSSGFTRVAQL